MKQGSLLKFSVTFGLILQTIHAVAALGVHGKPNVLFIVSDNFNPNVLGCVGHPLVKTPHIDRLAREGTFFTNCYCASPLCAPARASLMSGMFPSDVDSWCNATPFRGQVPTWGHHLREDGYRTVAIGKMDLTAKVDLGFEQRQTTHGHEIRPDVTALFRRPLCYRINERPDIDGKTLNRGHADEAVTVTALEFLDNTASQLTQPWALYVGFVGPLPGFSVEPKYAGMYPPGQIKLPDIPEDYLESMPQPWQSTRSFKRIATPISEDRQRRALSAYYGNVTALDERIGRLLDSLERTGLKDSTVVVYTADHGRSLGEHGLWFHNEPTDHSSRVTLTMTGPGIPANQRISTPVMHVDLYPTLLALAQVSIPAGLRGHSLLPLLQGNMGDHPGIAYSECHAEGTCTGSFIIRKGPWKYIYYSYYDDLLFNMNRDPEEMHDLIDTEEGKRVSKELHKVLLSLVDPDRLTEKAFARQEQMLADLCDRMSLEELLDFGFERRLGRGQAITLLKKYKP